MPADVQADPASGPQRIGVLLVHGIGQQRRFEHLNGQGRQIIQAIIHRHGAENVTVEIERGPAAALHAEQDTWATGKGAPVRVVVRDGQAITHRMHLHEMWWADVNETSSMAKQIRFWLWGLAVWAYPLPDRAQGGLQGTASVGIPQVPPGEHPFATILSTRFATILSTRFTTILSTRFTTMLWTRGRLFAIGMFFVVTALPIGIPFAALQRMLNLRVPDLLKVLADYISGVKLFNQQSRFGAPLGLGNDDFLDALGEPPRVSVRRRMMRMVAQMAEANYDRWYVVAHSQGTVPAFNALMETPYAWPGYFDEDAWRNFCKATPSRPAFGGPSRRPMTTGPTMPRRPVWAGPQEIAYRREIFARFGGLLTLGSPLQKFAAIWPARVPIARIPAFGEDAIWINVSDPLDPVSGTLSAFRRQTDAQCPRPQEVGYTSSPILLLAHLDYLKWTGKDCLAAGVAGWLLGAPPEAVTQGPGRYRPGSRQFKLRRVAAWAWWLGIFLVMAVLAGWLAHCLGRSPRRLLAWQSFAWAGYAMVTAFGVTLAAGAISFGFLFGGRSDAQAPSPDLGTLPQP